MKDLFNDLEPEGLTVKGLFSNGFLSARPFEDYQMDAMPYSARFWATIAKHKQEGYQAGFDACKELVSLKADEVEETAKDDELGNVHECIRALSFRAVDTDWQGDTELRMEVDGYERMTKAEMKRYANLFDLIEEKVKEAVANYIESKDLT